MATSTPPNLMLWGTYGDRYNEIVQPERKYTISHYLRTQWAPLLGAARLWFIIALRQRCFWNNKQDWCIVDKETLAQEAGISVRSANRMVKEHGYVSWFLDKTRRRRYSERISRTVNAPNRYNVLLDDPLTPSDQGRLRHFLTQSIQDGSHQTTLQVLQDLCACSDAALGKKLGAPVSLSQEQVLPAAFVLDVIQDCCPLPPQESAAYVEIARAASRLHNTLTRPERVYMGNQYFRMHWLPILGPALSLLIINLRARCYWNEHTGELRNTCQSTWKALAHEMGCTSRQLRNVRQQAHLAQFVTVTSEGRGAAPTQFEIQMMDPLTPQDQQRFDQASQTSPGADIDPETGQISMHPLLVDAEILAQSSCPKASPTETPEQSEPEVLAHEDAEELTPSGQKFWHVGGIRAEILARQSGNFGTILKLLIITPQPKGLSETTVEVVIRQEDESKISQDLVLAAVLDKQFTSLTLQEPNKGKLLALRPSCGHVLAWWIYALTQPRLKQNKVGYVYNRLLAGDTPPPACLAAAALSPSTWRLFYHAARSHDETLLPPSEMANFAKWQSLFRPIWNEISLELEPVQEAQPRAGGAEIQVPAALRSLLRGDEQIERHGTRLDIAVPSLYRAYRLARAAAALPSLPAEILFLDGYDRKIRLNEEILALCGLEPLEKRLWQMMAEELQWQMPRTAFERWWGKVHPLGVLQGAEEKGTVVFLGVPSQTVLEWLSTRQLALAERTLSGIWGQAVRVRFVIYDGHEVPVLA